MVFTTADVRQKLRELEGACHQALLGRAATPLETARDIRIQATRERTPRAGLSLVAGRAQLLHDLANIELQAMELALRGVIEYPEAPPQLREELAALALSEGEHLKLCLDALEELGHKWGDWPIHLSLWQTIAP